jgi:hypothetical protein
MPSNLDQILAFLRGQLGLTPAQAAGVAGNLQVESGFDPAAYNPREDAVGIAQWEGGRLTNLRRFAQQRGTSERDLSTQLAFLQQEFSGPEAGAYARLRQTTTPAEAAAVFDQYYERSAGTSRAQRVTNAQKIANGAAGVADTVAGVLSGIAGAARGSSAGTSAGSGSPGGSYASTLGGGLFDWQPGVFTIALKIAGAAAAGGLVIAGAIHTVKD